ncbi:MAG TPA: transglutaminase-like domain-containing protein [Abditibacterium sp.]|jgi:transglutaminase-like putative cysteine protease
MDKSLSRPPVSGWMIAAVLTALLAFYGSTSSPFAPLMMAALLASLVVPQRLEHDAGSIWGLRLLIYLGCALLGRSSGGSNFSDRDAFMAAGLIAGGELLLQIFREPPPGARFNGWIVLLSGMIFLIACNTWRPHISFLAPLYVLFLLLCLPDLRPRVAARPFVSNLKRVGLLLLAVSVGTALHQTLWTQQSALMSLGARLLSDEGGQRSQGGVSDSPQLESSISGNVSTTRLMRITGYLSDARLRAASFERYREGHWEPPISRRGRFTDALPAETREEDRPGHDAPRNRTDAKITVLSTTGGVLFAPLNAWAVMPELGQSFNWDRFRGPFVTEEPPPVSYYIVNSRRQKYDFEVEQGPLCVRPDVASKANPDPDEAMEELLQVPPEIEPRVAQLAQQITRGASSQSEKAALLVDYLFRTHPYSLEFTRTSRDPVSDFVLNKKGGHCQYFASALTIMLRCVGIPARYTTGYYAHETDDSGNTVVRGRDAHAWSEAYLKNLGWIALDATPPSGRADPRVNELSWSDRALENAQDSFARLRAWFGRLTQAQIGGMLLLVATVWGLERWRQARKLARKRDVGPALPAELAPLARRFERVLARRGISLGQSRPWSESVPAELAPEREWIEIYNRARFDARGSEQLQTLDTHLKQLEKQKVGNSQSA